MDKLSPEFATDLIELVASLSNLPKEKEVEVVSKKTGAKFKFKYTPLDVILAKVKANKNFSLLQPIFHDDLTGLSYVENILIHKSGEIYQSGRYKLKQIEGGSMQDDGSNITYARRYSLGAFLGVSTDEENDDETKEPIEPQFITPDQIAILQKQYPTPELWQKLLEKNEIEKIESMPYKVACNKIEALRVMAKAQQAKEDPKDANA